MSMTVYWGSGSPFAWSVLLALEFKGMSYESRRLDMGQGEHKTPAFLQLNPRGKVPVLVDGDVVITESLAILTYLEAKQPEPSLFGRDPVTKARIMEALSVGMSYVESAGFPIPLTIFFKPWDEVAQAAVRQGVEAVLPELQRIEATLSRQKALVGDDLSAADLRLYAVLQLVWRSWLMAEKKGGVPEMAGILRDRFPAIDRWCARIEALPGYDKTYPPHWRKA